MAAGQEIEALTLYDLGNFNGTSNEFANTITGNALANHLDGAFGDDVLEGGLGQTS